MAMQRLPDAELVVMQELWGMDTEATSAQIMARLEGKREWTVTTVLTLLGRLAERGFLAIRKQGKVNVYRALIEEEDYLATESASFLARLHGNSLTSLVSALYGGKAISQSDLRELQLFIDQEAKGGEVQ